MSESNFATDDDEIFRYPPTPMPTGEMPTWEMPTPMPTWEIALTGISLTLIIIFTIVSNVLVILAVYTHRPLRKVQNYFIVSLAVADLTVAIFVMPFNVVYITITKWIFGRNMCEMYLTCVIMCCTASILNLCAIALDRYWAITDPINYAQKRTLKRVMIMISLVWAISFVISFPPLLGWNDWPDEISEEMQCYLPQNAGYVIYSALGSFFCPLVLMIIIYVKIYKATKRRLHERAQKSKLKKLKASRNLRAITLANPDENRSEQTLNRSVTPCLKSDIETTSTDVEHSGHYNAGATIGSVDGVDRQSDGSVITKFIANRQRISLTQERRLVRTLTIIMGSFVICWLPFLILYVILPFCSPCKYLNMKVFDFIQWLSYVNSAFNPVIYTVFNKDFRAAIHNIIMCRTC